MLLHYLEKLKIQIFLLMGRKRKQIAFLIATNFVIHPQILIFSVFATLFSYCRGRLQSSLHPTCGRQTARTWTRSTTVSVVSCRNEFTRLQCVTQLTSNSASLRRGRAFHRLSSTKPMTSEDYDYEPASKQRDVTSSTRCNQPALFRTTHIEENNYALHFPPYLLNICRKFEFLIFQGTCLSWGGWVVSYGFCSEFHTLSSNAKILTIG